MPLWDEEKRLCSKDSFIEVHYPFDNLIVVQEAGNGGEMNEKSAIRKRSYEKSSVQQQRKTSSLF